MSALLDRPSGGERTPGAPQPQRAGGRRRLVRALDRPRLWRATAAGAALLLVLAVVVAAQGSFTLAAAPSAPVRGWTQWCTRGQARLDRRLIASCARVEGIVVARAHGPDPGELHVAVIGGFHLTLVKLPDYARAPGLGARIVAIGPLVWARDARPELQAFHWGGA